MSNMIVDHDVSIEFCFQSDLQHCRRLVRTRSYALTRIVTQDEDIIGSCFMHAATDQLI